MQFVSNKTYAVQPPFAAITSSSWQPPLNKDMKETQTSSVSNRNISVPNFFDKWLECGWKVEKTELSAVS